VVNKGITMNADIVVIGAGLVGSAIAYRLASRKVRVVVLDGSDREYRAANGNGGLVWLQGKGLDMPAYQQLTRDSVDRWPDFSAELTDVTTIDLQYEHEGALALCLSEAEFEQRRAMLLRWQNQLPISAPDWEMIDRDTVSKLLPRVTLGSEVVGASFGHRDGHVNPLRLLAALQAGIVRKGGDIRGGRPVRSVQSDRGGAFTIDLGTEKVSAARIVIAAGLGSKSLAAQVGLDIPIRPQRGQMLITERLEPFLPLPLFGMSQTRQGTVSIGTTNEEVGFDTSTTGEAAAAMSAMTLRWIPALSDVKLVRQWAALRILTPDGFSVYAESQSHPGAFVAVCHSGVTLAAAHATLLADAIAAGRLSSSFDEFHHRRFDVRKAA
jgi:glycine/D-amino acid oxidase-like deaminating enzyme